MFDINHQISGLTIRINRLSYIQGVRSGQVRVGRGDGQNEAGVLADELHDHVLDLSLDILGLITHRYLGKARKVDKGYVQN